jgi:phosphopantetheinyl transferase (holo-ACP synthase)
MVGNDVVDLGDPEARSGATHPRFDTRVFAPSELRALGASGVPNRLRWMLWAAKEAAYKVARKLDRRTVFSPPRFVVRLGATGAGEVRHAGGVLAVRVEAGPDRVHAVAFSGPIGRAALRAGGRVGGLHAGVIAVPPGVASSPGAAVRRAAVQGVAELVGADPSELEIVKRGRIPTVCRGAERLRVDLSLSHHGRYAAWACEIPPIAEGSA